LCFLYTVCSVKIHRSCVANGPYEKVWSAIGNFGNLKWMDSTINIELDYPRNGFFPRRAFRFGPVLIKENLIAAKNETDVSFVKYDFETGFEAFKVDNYIAILTVRRITNSDTTFVSWETTFDLRNGEEGEKEKLDGLFTSTIQKISEMSFHTY
jgi:hypothetical protein